MEADLINTFVVELLKKADLDKVPQDFYDEYVEKIGLEVQKRLGLVAMKELSPEAVDQFGELIKNDASPKDLVVFFQENIPDYQEKIEMALKDFADEFLVSVEKLK